MADDLRALFAASSLPAFRRLDEYAGPWAIEWTAFNAFLDMANRIDLARHMAEAADAPPEPKSAVEYVSAGANKTVAVVPLVGMLMKQRSSLGGTSTVQVRRELRAAAADPNVSAVLLAVESPGGTVSGTDDLAAEVRSIRRAGRKPVWAHVDDLCASAAYWVASQAEQVWANGPTAMVGSIGTIMTLYDASERLERDGTRAMVFATGSLKGAGVFGSRVTDEQQAYFQGLVNASQAEFDRWVKDGRRLSDEQLARVRTGAVYSARDAKAHRLIDGVRSFEETVKALSRAEPGRGDGR